MVPHGRAVRGTGGKIDRWTWRSWPCCSRAPTAVPVAPATGSSPATTRRPSGCRCAGHGIVGDRYAGRPAHARAAVTLLDAGALDAVAAELGVPAVDPLRARRNVVLRAREHLDLDALRGQELELVCGTEEPVRLRVHRPAAPCAWMDVLLAPGAHRALRGRAGVRCEPTRSGVLRVGPARLSVLV